MAKCIRCGKSTLVRGYAKLEDGAICTPCWKSLGFKITDAAQSRTYRYEDIKDGRDNLSRNLARRKAKHQKWLEEHPEVLDFMAAIDEGRDEDPGGQVEETDEE